MSYDYRSLSWKGNKLFVHGFKEHLLENVPDTKYPKMWRVKYPDGRLTDMVNLTRAKDAAANILISKLNKESGDEPRRTSEEA